MTETSLDVVNGEVLLVAPTASVTRFQEQLDALRDFTKANLREGVDYGRIPGTPKPTLLKPGAEKLLRWFGLVVDAHFTPGSRLDPLGAIIDVDVEGVVRHAKTGAVLGTVHANCNSEERRYRNARIGDGKQTIADQKNTIIKMADKRAWVAAALLYTGASEAYTQDLEDMVLPPQEEEAQPSADLGYCPVHHIPFVHRVGTSKAGKAYDFWACPAKDGDKYCKEKPREVPADQGPQEGAPADNPGAIKNAVLRLVREKGSTVKLALRLWAETRGILPVPENMSHEMFKDVAKLQDFHDFLKGPEEGGDG